MSVIGSWAKRLPVLAASVLLASGAATPRARAQSEAQTPAGTQAGNQTQPPGGVSQQDWFDQREMTGNWGGLRTRLAREGIIVRGHYVAEMAGNPVGGRAQGFRYAHEVMLGADLDLAKLTGAGLGQLHLTLTERAGRSLASDMIGNTESVQEIYGSGERVRLTELAWQSAIGPHIDTELGWINTETDFAASPVYWGMQIYCLYQSNAICGMPQALAANSGYGFYPTAKPGGWIKAYPTPGHDLVLATGAYDVDPSIVNTHNGFKLGLQGATGLYVPVELGWHHGHSDDSGAMRGNLHVGGYYDTSEVRIVTGSTGAYQPRGIVLTGLPAEERRGRYGMWANADQMVERDRDDHDRGVLVWATFEWGDPKTSLFPYFGSAGITRKGTFARRPNDTVDLGFIAAALNPKLAAYESTLQAAGRPARRQAQEMVGELNYGYEIAHWFVLRPGVQYVWHPSGENEIANAFVMDLQLNVTF